jgi:hypothetical protein
MADILHRLAIKSPFLNTDRALTTREDVTPRPRHCPRLASNVWPFARQYGDLT